MCNTENATDSNTKKTKTKRLGINDTKNKRVSASDPKN